MLDVKNLKKSFGNQLLFENISFSLEIGQKMALIGPNGVGKSTLIKILAGLEESDYGDIKVSKDLNIIYLQQELKFEDNLTIKDFWGEELKDKQKDIEKMLKDFGVDKDENEQISNLSPGQKVKINLIKSLLSNPDLLLLDEPTNNLDIATIISLERILKKTKVSLIIISHDNDLLENVVDKTFYIDWKSKNGFETKGGVEKLSELLEQKGIYHRKSYEKYQENTKSIKKQIRETGEKQQAGAKFQGSDNDKMARDFKRGRSSSSGRKIKALKSKLKQLTQTEKPLADTELNIELSPSSTRFQLVLRDITFSIKDFNLNSINLNINPSDKIALIGPNGSGKTTLLKLIKGDIESSNGKRILTGDINIGNYDQVFQELENYDTPLKFLSEKTEAPTNEIIHMLIKYGISSREVKDDMHTLSPGKRARILYALFSLNQSNIILLDEPTNHLDLISQQSLIEILNEFKGAVVVVTHDRKLLRTVKFTSIIEINNSTSKSIHNIEEII